jgi:hypothetical protein
LPVYISAALYFCPPWVPEAVSIVFGSPIAAWLFNNLLTNLKNKMHDY